MQEYEQWHGWGAYFGVERRNWFPKKEKKANSGLKDIIRGWETARRMSSLPEESIDFGFSRDNWIDSKPKLNALKESIKSTDFGFSRDNWFSEKEKPISFGLKGMIEGWKTAGRMSLLPK